MITAFSVNTKAQEFLEVTAQVKSIVAQSGVVDGICCVYCAHTTAGVTINENADPDVVRDMLIGLDRAFPDTNEFRHFEGNSSAHLKASAVGSSVTVPVESATLTLGRWQGIYLCEFDGPKTRNVTVAIVNA